MQSQIVPPPHRTPMQPEPGPQFTVEPPPVTGHAARPGLRDWLEAARAAPRLVLVWAMLSLAGIQRLRRWTRNPGRAGPQTLPPERIAARVLALRRVGARLPGCRCLARSMALSWWLNRNGQAHSLHIGIHGTAIDLRAHSWVAIAGQPVDDSPESIARFRKISEI